MSEKPITITPSQLQELIAAVKAPSQAELDKQAQVQREQQEVRRITAETVKREEQANEVRQSTCRHKQGSRFTERGLTQGESNDSAIVINYVREAPEKSFAICQHCQKVWYYNDPKWAAIMREAY
ncbi:MAG TPA: hypothetical protein VHK86_08805 [Nitrososphaera sp.]|jgi:hypothetical protein|nr:hypothetical protein [Nitrososphaera sp.]HEX3319706.1 hypothetical protein [Terriglobales bacterium]